MGRPKNKAIYYYNIYITLLTSTFSDVFEPIEAFAIGFLQASIQKRLETLQSDRERCDAEANWIFLGRWSRRLIIKKCSLSI